jgi:hypothetical protein
MALTLRGLRINTRAYKYFQNKVTREKHFLEKRYLQFNFHLCSDNFMQIFNEIRTWRC